MGGLLCGNGSRMDDRILTEMPLDELWARIEATLFASRLEIQRMSLRVGCAAWVQIMIRTNRIE
jgi:hypothetical protein